MLLSVATTRSGVLLISTPACTGPLACSARSAARPSQNWAALNTALNTVGEFRGLFCQPWPIEVGNSSSPPRPTVWQGLQLIRWLEDSRGSKDSILPSSTLVGVSSLPSITGGYVGTGSNMLLAQCI